MSTICVYIHVSTTASTPLSLPRAVTVHHILGFCLSSQQQYVTLLSMCSGYSSRENRGSVQKPNEVNERKERKRSKPQSVLDRLMFCHERRTI